MLDASARASHPRHFRLRSLWPARPRTRRVKWDCDPLISARPGVPHGA